METLPKPQTRGLDRLTLTVFVAVTFVSASLVFLVQPMAARLILPRFGGSAAVWNTALMVFQVLLLAGYTAAHLLTKLPPKWRRVTQLAVVALPVATLPFAVPDNIDLTSPVSAVVFTLAVMVGAPYFALTTMSPTMQRWFGETGHRLSINPYPLYAAGNVGSLLALIAYPLGVEFFFTSRQQTLLFAGLYVTMVLLAGAAAVLSRRVPEAKTLEVSQSDAPTLTTSRTLYLAFVPSFMLLGITRHIASDVASLPLLWVIPLVIYLATFIVAFRGKTHVDAATRALRLLLIPAVMMSGRTTLALAVTLTIPLLVLLMGAYVAHRRLYDGRPPVAGLTKFYMLLSVGGAAGGVAGALVAPVVFDRVAEYPIALVLAATLVITAPTTRSVIVRIVTVALIGLVLISAVFIEAEMATLLLVGGAGLIAHAASWRSAVYIWTIAAMAATSFGIAQGDHVLTAQRTFYGTYEVHDRFNAHTIISGSTVHGIQQWEDGASRPAPLVYYSEAGPFGTVLRALGDEKKNLDIGVIGLGAGSLAAYLDTSDRMTFYEIDPLVLEFASNPEFFTFLSDTEGQVETFIGDGRLELESRKPTHDILMVDAFTSDAIPLHLLSVEAMETYLDSVTDDGIVFLHISNRHFDLVPILEQIADHLGLHARLAQYAPDPDDPFGEPTVAMALSASATALESVTTAPYWTDPPDSDAPLWTDDFSNVLSAIDW